MQCICIDAIEINRKFVMLRFLIYIYLVFGESKVCDILTYKSYKIPELHCRGRYYFLWQLRDNVVSYVKFRI